MGSKADYTDAWRDLRLRRYALLAAFALPLPVVMAVAFVAPDLAAVVAIVGIACWVAAVVWHAMFCCPRCGYFFLWTWWRSSLTGRNCIHCGLRRGAASDIVGQHTLRNSCRPCENRIATDSGTAHGALESHHDAHRRP